ncbi:OmpH family outer membrane protein [Fulvivirgaceae bacterium LMO-SS25]
MKNLSLILNIVLLIAVIYLYVDKFSGNSSETTIASMEESGDMALASDLNIAYINSDTLLAKYDYFTEITGILEEKRNSAQAEYSNRAQGLQQEIETFQRTAQGMTMAQARAKEEELVQKQQTLQVYEQNLSQELMNEEAKLTNALYDTIADYLATYGKSRNLNIILTYTKGSGVLYANEGLDITNEAIKGLNERYTTNKN